MTPAHDDRPLSVIAAAVGDGLRAGAYWTDNINEIGSATTIADAQAAFAEYRRRVEALEAFVAKVVSAHEGMRVDHEPSYESVMLVTLALEARALLATTAPPAPPTDHG
jgi:hypothetical protein